LFSRLISLCAAPLKARKKLPQARQAGVSLSCQRSSLGSIGTQEDDDAVSIESVQQYTATSFRFVRNGWIWDASDSDTNTTRAFFFVSGYSFFNVFFSVSTVAI
jgi:hypothetical protein